MSESLAPSLRLQSTIVHALVMQDMSSRYASGRLGLLLAFIEPMLMLVGIYFLRSFIKGAVSVGGVPLILFIVTGFMIFYCWRLFVNGVAGATRRKAASRMFPQVTSMDAIVARAISGTIIYAGVVVLSFIGVYLYTGSKPIDILLILAAIALTFAFALPVGILIGVLERLFPAAALFMSLVLRINVFLSGAMFLASEMPSGLQQYVVWNPLFHMIEMMREAWFPGYVSPFIDLNFVIITTIVLLAVGLSLERITSRFKFG